MKEAEAPKSHSPSIEKLSFLLTWVRNKCPLYKTIIHSVKLHISYELKILFSMIKGLFCFGINTSNFNKNSNYNKVTIINICWRSTGSDCHNLSVILLATSYKHVSFPYYLFSPLGWVNQGSIVAQSYQVADQRFASCLS